MPLRPHLHGFLFQYLSKGVMDTSLIHIYTLSSVRQLHMATLAAGINMTQHSYRSHCQLVLGARCLPFACTPWLQQHNMNVTQRNLSSLSHEIISCHSYQSCCVSLVLFQLSAHLPPHGSEPHYRCPRKTHLYCSLLEMQRMQHAFYRCCWWPASFWKPCLWASPSVIGRYPLRHSYVGVSSRRCPATSSCFCGQQLEVPARHFR